MTTQQDRANRIETAKQTYTTCNGVKARYFFKQKFPYADSSKMSNAQIRAALINSLPAK